MTWMLVVREFMEEKLKAKTVTSWRTKCGFEGRRMMKMRKMTKRMRMMKPRTQENMRRWRFCRSSSWWLQSLTDMVDMGVWGERNWERKCGDVEIGLCGGLFVEGGFHMVGKSRDE